MLKISLKGAIRNSLEFLPSLSLSHFLCLVYLRPGLIIQAREIEQEESEENYHRACGGQYMWFETLVTLLAMTGNLNTLVRSFILRFKSHISKMLVFLFLSGLSIETYFQDFSLVLNIFLKYSLVICTPELKWCCQTICMSLIARGQDCRPHCWVQKNCKPWASILQCVALWEENSFRVF